MTTDLVVVAGEITTKADLSPRRRRRPGPRHRPRHRLHRSEHRLRGRHLPGHVATCTSSRGDIAMGVDTGGAGDQGMMFGFACNETSTLMPLPIYLAHRLVENHARLRESGELKFVRPDAKSQVTVEYDADGTPHRIHTVVLSTQHDDSVDGQEERQGVLLRRRPPGDRRQADPADAEGRVARPGQGRLALVMPGTVADEPSTTTPSAATSTRPAASWSAARTATAA